jgi:hypothetical protein
MSLERTALGNARDWNARAWTRARSRPGLLHPGMRTRRSAATLDTERDGYATVGPCPRCWPRYIQSRVYAVRLYRIRYGQISGPELVRERRFAFRCAPCKAETRRARLLRGTNQARARDRAEARSSLACVACGASLPAARRTRRFCSVRCRVAAWRNATGRRRAPAGTSDSVTVTH